MDLHLIFYTVSFDPLDRKLTMLDCSFERTDKSTGLTHRADRGSRVPFRVVRAVTQVPTLYRSEAGCVGSAQNGALPALR